eukprot:CAMPEP_0115867118 /NCGR_PEP_ID=MMETSP0287-20121206/20602_1 /TAXON_ID=412157 /ORGANISM="Chrysochromulina rotalis, Strain UIO044" /LENGTH=192 /DNA_ID=CAMNT_0003321711 /DNA_START=19 /DNA_END=597 /DNA_ORIENTATION=-
MASSVASAREMERWARERREATQRTVNMPVEAARQMQAMQPDFEALQKYEKKVQQLAQRQEDREEELKVDPVINVMGSTAGAGSGDFHTYRGYRTKELARLADFEKEAKREQAQKTWEEERRGAQAEVEARSAKSAAKRNKKKEKRKATMAAEKAAKAAKRTEGAACSPAAHESSAGEDSDGDHRREGKEFS